MNVRKIFVWSFFRLLIRGGKSGKYNSKELSVSSLEVNKGHYYGGKSVYSCFPSISFQLDSSEKRKNKNKKLVHPLPLNGGCVDIGCSTLHIVQDLKTKTNG